MAIEVLAIALAVMLAILTFLLADVALLVIVGVVRISRCGHCHRLRLTTAHGPLYACARCRHERLLHPVHALHRSASGSHGGA